jgi:predicted dienelactone hydrolase
VVSAAPALGLRFQGRDAEGAPCPLQLWRAENDEILPDPFYASPSARQPAQGADYHVVAKARHFDFLTPCNNKDDPGTWFICSSAPDFDRAAFHPGFQRQGRGVLQGQPDRPAMTSRTPSSR